jgi:hypothetical protein
MKPRETGALLCVAELSRRGRGVLHRTAGRLHALASTAKSIF